MRVRRRFAFEAAHSLPYHPGKCRELHGHSYVLKVTVDRPIDPGTGMGIDFADLKGVVKSRVIDHLDHKTLNDLIENPTAELMAVWIWKRLSDDLTGLQEIELRETTSCSVLYRGE